MKRAFIAAIAAYAICGPAAAQSGKLARVGVLSVDGEAPGLVALQELPRLGWTEGKNIVFDRRHLDATDKLAELAGELVRRKVDVIVTFGAGVAAARRATSSIPIVMATSQDPIRAGFAASLARPGGNITGVTYLTDQLAEKRLQFAKEAIPSLRRLAVIWEPAHVDNELKGLQSAAATLGIEVQSIEVPRPVRANEVEIVIQAALQGRADAVVLAPGGFTIRQRKALIAQAARHRVPVVSAWPMFAEDGALLTYGPEPTEMSRRLASYVDRVLKGARPGDLPIEQPSQFQLVVNRKAAKAIGISVAQQVVQRADWVIE